MAHEGSTKSLATHASGQGPLQWKACFYGDHASITVNGKKEAATPLLIHGVRASAVTVTLSFGQSATAEVLP